MDDALALRIELASPVEAARKGMERPDTDDADEASPVRRWLSLSTWLDGGRRSGNSVLTKVVISDGQMTMKGCTSTVSRGDVIAFAGSRTGLECVFVCLNLARMLSMCVRISGKIGCCCRLGRVSFHTNRNGQVNTPLISHVEDMLLRPNGDFPEDLLTSMLRDVVSNHNAVRLCVVSMLGTMPSQNGIPLGESLLATKT
jgi:hypothetical protein